MPLGRKTKIESRLNLLNKIVLDAEPDEADFIAELLGDTVLKALNDDMVTILGAIRAKAATGSPGVNNIQTPPTVPVPKRRYMGVLAFDTTTKSVGVGDGGQAGDVKYTYDHVSAFRLNAQAFRDRIDNLLKLREQQNDLTDAHKRPNPGMWLGYEKQ